MPRIRSLKPDFFTSEQIVSVSIPARYLFEGIWVFGDDEGYIANSPIQLKMRIFPGDSVDVPALIGELLAVGLVQEVATDQGDALWVPSFRNHQSPKYPTPTKYTVDGHSLTQHSPSGGEHVRKRSPRTHPGEERRGEERSREEIEEPLSPDESDDHAGSLISDSWRPNQTHIDKAASLRLDVDREQSRFRDNAIRTQRRLKNWNAGFTNWLRKAAEFNQQRQGRPAPTGRPSPTDRIAAILAIGEQEGIEA